MIVNVSLPNLKKATRRDKDIIQLMELKPILVSNINFANYTSQPDKYINQQLNIVKYAEFYVQSGKEYKYYTVEDTGKCSQ